MASDLFLQPAPVEMKPERLGTLMSKPLIIVLSERARWTNELPNSASDGFEFVTCSDVEALPKLAQDNEAAGVLADLTNVSGGGHLQERVLELLCDRMTDLPVAMVTDEECPEPLERRALYSGIMHLRGEVTVDRVLDWLAERLPANMTNTAADTATSDVEDRSEEHEEGDTKDEPLAITADSKPQSGNKDSSAVLSGITRRFETYSPEMKRMLEEVAIAADKDVTMLLIGETGSGKTY
ncbi:MAG: hypothetical protein ACI8P0_005830, partial [Planctomycetaceae bacterium]